jgi:hypothetical protein
MKEQNDEMSRSVLQQQSDGGSSIIKWAALLMA